jgi:hypothetical protein
MSQCWALLACMRSGDASSLESMPQTETISAAMVLRLVRLVEHRGFDADRLLARAQLSRVGLEAASARVSYAAADRLLELFAAEVRANGLGIDLALTRSDEAYGAAGLCS